MTAIQIITLVVALVGAATGIASLVWAIASHQLSGSRVKVRLVGGWMGQAGLVSAPIEGFKRFDQPSAEYPVAVVGVQANNVGRLPVAVTSWGIGIGPARLGFVQAPVNNPLPHVLGVGEEATWFAAEEDVIATAVALRIGPGIEEPRLAGSVQLGTDKSAIAKESYPLSVLHSWPNA
jgi:hypothetical protein